MMGVFIALYSLSLSLSQPSFTFSSTCCCWVVAKSCQSLCEPMNYGPPGSSIHGISQRPTPTKKKARFGERAHWQRPLRTQGWESPPGGDAGQKALGLPEVWAETTAPRLGREHFPAPFSLPSVCPAPHLPGALGSRPWYSRAGL